MAQFDLSSPWLEGSHCRWLPAATPGTARKQAACYLTWHLRRALAPLTFTDEDPSAQDNPVAPARLSTRAQAQAQAQAQARQNTRSNPEMPTG
jgi:hypothetical protein